MTSTAQLEGLIHDPAQRVANREINYAMTLSFLRNEPYSTAPMIAELLDMGVPGARRVLRQLVAKDWVVHDQLPLMGMRSLHIYAASAVGRYQFMDEFDIGLADLDPPARGYSRGRVKWTMLEHTLMVQSCRIHFMKVGIDRFLEDKSGLVEPGVWMAESQMPDQNKSRTAGRWPVYPDGILSQVIVNKNGEPYKRRIAVEAERTPKEKRRYVNILRAHRQNIAADRYDRVYYCVKADERDGYERRLQTADPGYEQYLDVVSVD